MSNTAAARPARSQVDEKLTWDLSALFKSDDDWYATIEIAKKELEAIVAFQGHLCKDGKTLDDCLLILESTYTKLIQLGTYADLLQAEDGTNPKNQERAMFFGGIMTGFKASLSFIDSEITALDAKNYSQLFVECADLNAFKVYLDDIYDKKSHQLGAETEKTLASLGELSGSPYQTYSVSKAADMVFENFDDHEGMSLPNSFALFESNYEYSRYAPLRKNAYASFVKTLERYKNTYAAVYSAEVRKQIAMSRIRGYESATHMLLEPHKVPVDMYNKQIDIIYTELAPHMRRFAGLVKKQLGLPEMRFCDLKAPLDPDFKPAATIPEIENTLVDAMKILGEDYSGIIKKAFSERWIDFADNVGKSTGAFCASPYGSHSYILITYQENMRSAFMLAHELGHAGHFTLTNAAQRVFNTEPSTYFVEAPSTINEMFLGEYLMKKTMDSRMKRWVILQLLGTYYHNFVTHLLEAEFQRRVYAMAERDIPLTAQSLCSTMLEVLRTFWGDSVAIDDGAGMTWMRQPHYYMGLYPYTYSAGLSAATAISRAISEEGKPAADRWLKVLKAGGTLPPKELLAMAGLDMSTPAPIKVAVDYVGSLISQLEDLFK